MTPASRMAAVACQLFMNLGLYKHTISPGVTFVRVPRQQQQEGVR